jgi:hypothetical protein
MYSVEYHAHECKRYPTVLWYEGVSESFRTGRLERELQMV